MTGAIPAQSGIIANEWYDRASGAVVTSVSDNNEQLLGDAGKASSPRRLLVSTVGDQLKMSGRKGAKVVGISMKDRAAILPAGHMANGAYWFSHTSGNFVSSTYYFTQLPAWVDAFNARKLPATYAGKAWMTLDTQKPFSLIQGDTPLTLNEGIYSSPFGNELLESFAEAALDGEKLGQSGSTDILTVSFSSIDAVGHAKGPDSLEMRDLCLRFDKTLGTLFDAIDKRVGLANSLIVFTSDHGVVPVPEVNQARRMPGGRLGKSVRDTLDAALTARYGAGKWIAAGLSELIYLDRNLIESRKLRLDEVQDFAAKTLMSVPHIERVFTSEDLRHGRIAPDPIAQRVAKGFHERRGADLYLVFESFWLDGSGTSGTSHGQPYNYDSHVPLVFLSPLVKPGAYHGRAAVYDIAPTLSAILGIEPPSAAFGRVLDEMLVQR
jgi:predicted AlkP superfamily pyrophosphatase or phosphodiesterase